MPSRRKASYCYDFPRPALTADAIVVSRESRPRVLLIRRKREPFAGKWALPGGFVEQGETIIEGCMRELREETGLEVRDLEQLFTAGDPGRDPRGWTVSVVFLGRVPVSEAKPGDDAAEVRWYPLDDLPELAFDHAMLLARAKMRLADGNP